MSDDYEMGFCSICGAPTALRSYPNEPLCWLCDGCYETWQRSDWDTLRDSALQNVTVTRLRWVMLHRRHALIDSMPSIEWR